MTAILLVDDSAAVRADLTGALEGHGFRVIPCATVGEARTALRTQPIALAILDTELPDGTGLELLELIRRDPILRVLPVLLLGSFDELATRVTGLDVSAADHLGKPYDRSTVLARVQARVGSPPVPETVLVLDGDEHARGRLCAALQGAGFTTREGATGAEAVSRAGSERLSAIVLDSATPDVDGVSVVKHLKLEPSLRTVPCIVVCGVGTRVTEVRALEAGADAFVRKRDPALIVARVQALVRSSGPARPDANQALAPKRLLAADDDPDYLALMATGLRKRGYEVITCGSGEETLERLASETVACIVLDRQMPGLGGVATCKALKASPDTRDIPLVILTSAEDRQAVIEGLAAGADDFVSKKSGLDILAARVQAQIRRKQIEDEQRSVRERLLHSELEASEARAAQLVAETRATLADELARTNAELGQANRELEAFSYSVSHDLRAPLRTISAFTHALAEDLGDALDDKARDHVRRVLAASARMADLIDALLELARLHTTPVARHRVDLSQLAAAVMDEIARREPERLVSTTITPGLVTCADGRLVRILLDNLLGNAWKFTAFADPARIELGTEQRGPDTVFFVRDNGAGFDMAHAERLFTPFHRMHTETEFKGTGIGLATVRRIVERHGGQIWADGAVGAGATLSFTLPPERCG